MRKSIFAKYFIIVVGIIAFSVMIFSSIVMLNSRQQWINENNKLLSRNVKTISAMLSENDGYYKFNIAQLYGTIDAIGEIIDATIFTVDENGQCNYSTDFDSDASPRVNKIIDLDIIKKVTIGKYVETGTLCNALETRCFIVGFPIEANGVQIGAVFAAMPIRQSEIYISSVFNSIAYAALIVMLIAFVATYLASAQMTRPLRNMATVVKKLESGNFSARISVDRHDEIGLLADSINKMAYSIGELEGMRRDFISSVSHELKTPMTTISGFIDGILDGTIPREQQDRYLRIVSDETKRLSRLVNSMLQLSHLESGKTKVNKTTFNLSDMIISVFLSFEQKIEAKHLEISGLDMLKPISVTADRDLIYQVIYNLTENAIKFTPENGVISVFCNNEKQNIKFSIKNSGEGIDKQELTKIFERFYKTDRSRSMDKTGMGFGLHIVKTILSLHNGSISVNSVLGEFTQFDVTLPNKELVAELDTRSDNKRIKSK